MSLAFGPARDGGVWVRAEKCATCIFHPGNLMSLRRGTVANMKRSADERGSCIICHEGMDSPSAAVCAGYFENHQSSLLQMAERMGVVKFETAQNPAHASPTSQEPTRDAKESNDAQER